jgi:hypothetical protein
MIPFRGTIQPFEIASLPKTRECRWARGLDLGSHGGDDSPNFAADRSAVIAIAKPA